MPQSILNALRFDHRLFAALLQAAENQVDALEHTSATDVPLLKAIGAYFEDYPHRHHHPFEEVIYGHLLCQMPSFADDVYGLVDDHQDVAARARAFRVAVERLDIHDPLSRSRFLSIARDFIEHERSHLTAEEQLFFPYAERLLTRQQWAEVARASHHKNSDEVSKDAIDRFPELGRVLFQTNSSRSMG